jgi:mycofactocin precursor peptide peptidase
VSRVVAETTWPTLVGPRLLIVPVGSLEQHGPHLPLGTDSTVAEAVATRAAAATSSDLAPLLPFSASGEHDGFPGVLSLGTTVTALALTELVRSSRTTWTGVVVVSGHGGNLEALAQVRERADAEGDRVRTWVPRWPDGDPHAGYVETSVALALGLPVGPTPPDVPLEDGWFERARTTGLRAVTESGVLGAPSRASADDGHRILHQWVGEVVALVHELEEAP